MPKWAQILLQLFARKLEHEGKTDQAAIITDALEAVRAGKNVDSTMQAYAETWVSQGAPSLESIVETRKGIQAAIGG